MGRKTFESIGKPLPNRKNIVLTNDKNFFYPNIIIINNYLEILKKYNADDVFIIGGKSIYELFFPFANKLIISKIKNEFLCDTFINLDIHKFKLEKKIPYKDFDVEYYAI
jgi:dihydrofolate reductase